MSWMRTDFESQLKISLLSVLEAIRYSTIPLWCLDCNTVGPSFIRWFQHLPSSENAITSDVGANISLQWSVCVAALQVSAKSPRLFSDVSSRQLLTIRVWLIFCWLLSWSQLMSSSFLFQGSSGLLCSPFLESWVDNQQFTKNTRTQLF